MLFCVDKQLAIAVLLNHEEHSGSGNKTMTCEKCETDCQRFGKHRNGLRRFRCPLCKKTYTEAHKPALAGSYIPQDRIVLALRLLIEGNSIRSTERITNLDRNTIMKILTLAGEKCEKLDGPVDC